MSNQCEDYPCCGHTDGLGCNWTYTPEARAYDIAHAECDHETGPCVAEYYNDYDMDDEEEEPEVDDDFPMSMEYPMEDQWLDGSYEEE